MRHMAGQAIREARGALHGVLAIIVTLAVALAVAGALVTWRLAQGPVSLSWATSRVAQAASTLGGGEIDVGDVDLVWEGFRAGGSAPLVIRVSGIVLHDAQARRIAAIPQAEVALSVAGLLHGRLRPSSLAVVAPQLRVWRNQDGSLEIGSAEATPGGDEPGMTAAIAAALAELAAPLVRDGSSGVLGELTRFSIRDADLTVIDRGLDTTWRVPRAAIELVRGAAGGIDGSAGFDVMLGDTPVHAGATITLPPASDRVTVTANLPPLRPSAIAAAVPRLALLADIDLPLTLQLTGVVDTGLRHPSLSAHVTLGQGGIHIVDGVLPVVSGEARIDGTLSDLDLQLDHLDVAATPEGARTRLNGWAHARHDGSKVFAALSLSLDRVTATDLPGIWPVGVGGPGTRPWIVENITDGVFANGHVDLALTAPDDFSDAEITYIAGGLDGHGMTLHWLRPVPPAEGLDGHLRLISDDSLDITVNTGQQTRAAGGPPIALKGGLITLTGLATSSQFADISAQLSGPVAELLGVLRHPRLKLLDKRPVPMNEPAGSFAGQLTVDRLPLKNELTVDEVRIQAAMKLTGVHLGGIAAGRDLDAGTLDLTAGNDGLKVTGTANLAGLPATLAIEEDFRTGGANQVLQKVTVATTVPADQMARFGTDASAYLAGRIGLRAELTERRSGRGEVVVRADLKDAELHIDDLNWKKPAGTAGTLDARLQLDHARLTGIDAIRLAGQGFNADASLDIADGKPHRLRFARVALGKAIDASGEIGWPASADGAWTIVLQGALLDASGPLTRTTPPPGPRKRGPLWTADLRFERVTMANDATLYALALRGSSDGWINPSLSMIGRTKPDGGAFNLTIAPDLAGRRLTAQAEDAGGLLRGLDIVSDMRGGQMNLTGRYDDTRNDHRLSGTAEITDFAMRNGAGFGKLLQAFSVYGLIDVIRSPDLAFMQLTAPFRLAEDTLEINDARAFNASLGMTAKGRADLGLRKADVQGTIVPIYFLNSLLGRLPLIGSLLSPEKGGGLIAANWSMRGDFDDPAIGVNPLSAITPGFLRGLFGVFDSPNAIPVPGDPPPAPRRMPTAPPAGGSTSTGEPRN